MARKRMIDPNIWQDEEFGSLSAPAKVLFIGLFSNADDEGRIRANDSYLKSTVFMYDNLSLDDVADYRKEVVSRMKSIKYYSANGKPYIQLLNWSNYQKQHKDRIQQSILPAYVDDVSDNVGQVTDNVGVSRLSKVKLSNIPADKPQASSKTYERIPEEKRTELQRIVYFLEDTLNTKMVNWGKQAKAHNAMTKAGYNEKQICYVIKQMANEEFYQDKGFDLQTVANNIAQYKAKARKGAHVLPTTK